MSDSDLLAAADESFSSSPQPPDKSSDPPILNSQGFIWEQIAFHKQGTVSNPPGQQSSTNVDSMPFPDTSDQSVNPPVDLATDQSDVSPAAPPADVPATPPNDFKQFLKPWITRGIQKSIKVKNALFASGNFEKYKHYRNKILTLISMII